MSSQYRLVSFAPVYATISVSLLSPFKLTYDTILLHSPMAMTALTVL